MRPTTLTATEPSPLPAPAATDSSPGPDARAAAQPLAGLGLLVAPSTGKFQPAPVPDALQPGALVGHVTGGRGRADEVRSPAAATVRGLLVRPGQHVAQGQAVVWVEWEPSPQPAPGARPVA